MGAAVRYAVLVSAHGRHTVLAARDFLTDAEREAVDLFKDFDRVYVDDTETGRQVIAMTRVKGADDNAASQRDRTANGLKV